MARKTSKPVVIDGTAEPLETRPVEEPKIIQKPSEDQQAEQAAAYANALTTDIHERIGKGQHPVPLLIGMAVVIGRMVDGVSPNGKGEELLDGLFKDARVQMLTRRIEEIRGQA